MFHMEIGTQVVAKRPKDRPLYRIKVSIRKQWHWDDIKIKRNQRYRGIYIPLVYYTYKGIYLHTLLLDAPNRIHHGAGLGIPISWGMQCLDSRRNRFHSTFNNFPKDWGVISKYIHIIIIEPTVLEYFLFLIFIHIQ